MAWTLLYCNRTRRWLLCQNENGKWTWPKLQQVRASRMHHDLGMSIGIIKPTNSPYILSVVEEETAFPASAWGWFGEHSIRALDQGRYVKLIHPQLRNIASDGVLREGKVELPPQKNLRLLFTDRPINLGLQRGFEVWYRSTRVAQANVDREKVLWDLGVKPKWRNKGIATLLMQHILASRYAPHKLKAQPSSTQPGLNLDQLINFYSQFGFSYVPKEDGLMVRYT